jgi:hypothetical protein
MVLHLIVVLPRLKVEIERAISNSYFKVRDRSPARLISLKNELILDQVAFVVAVQT